jgi:hypothetical protein
LRWTAGFMLHTGDPIEILDVATRTISSRWLVSSGYGHLDQGDGDTTVREVVGEAAPPFHEQPVATSHPKVARYTRSFSPRKSGSTDAAGLRCAGYKGAPPGSYGSGWLKVRATVGRRAHQQGTQERAGVEP